MDLVLRASVLYLFVLVILRLTGKRTMAQISTFDFVLLLLIAESTDNSIIGDDHALISTVVVIITFVLLEIILTFVKQKSKRLELLLEGSPVIILEQGKLIQERANKSKIDESDILAEARKIHGIERLDQIKYAILEKSGGISIIPQETK